MQAAVEATQEIGLAVLATTLSLVAIFVPVGFMGGIVGRFMTSFGLTMSFAILVSLLVSFTLTPMLVGALDQDEAEARGCEGHEVDGATSKDARFFRPLDSGYTSIAAVVAGAPRHRRRHRRARAAQQRAAVHARQQELPAERRPGGVRGRPARAGRHEPRGHRDHRQPDRDAGSSALPEVGYTLVSVADDPAQTQNSGTIYVQADAGRRARRDQFELMNVVRSEILPAVGVPNLRTGVRPVATIGGGGNQNAEIQFTINGPDLKRLEQYAGAVDRGSQEGARRRRRRHLVERRQAGALGAARSAEGGRSRRADFGCGRSAAACWSAATRSRPTTKVASNTRSTSARWPATVGRRRPSAS